MFGAPPSGASPFASNYANFGQQQRPIQQQQPQQQQAASSQQVHLLAKDTDQLKGQPVVHATKWDGIHPDSQNLLLTVENVILEHREESRRLDQSVRLNDSSALQRGFEDEASAISQSLSSLATTIHSEQASLQGLLNQAKDLLRNSEMVVRSFMAVQQRYPRAASTSGGLSSGGQLGSSVGGIAAPAPVQVPNLDFYGGVPMLPSPFLTQTVARFEHKLNEYQQRLHELERLLLSAGNGESKQDSRAREASLMQSIPQIMTNIHQFFIHVTAEAEVVHNQVTSARNAYLGNRRRRGDDRNPFLEADRREAAKREAAAKISHPGSAAPLGPATMPPLLPAPQVAPFPSNQSILGSAPAATTAGATTPSFFGGFGGAGGATTAAAPSPFSTPTAGGFGSSLFGGSGAATTPAGGMPSLFGAAPTTPATAPSLFGTPATPPSAFGNPSTPAFGAASGGGGLFGSGGSIGGTSLGFGTPQTPATPGSGLFKSGSGGFGGGFGAATPGTPAAMPSAFGFGTPATGAAAKPKPRAGSRRK